MFPGNTVLTAVAATPQVLRETGLCYYHERFGLKAKRWHSLCSFSRAGNAGAGPQYERLPGRHAVHSGHHLRSRFLCDTGAQRSVLPASRVDFEDTNGSHICTYGTSFVELCFEEQRFG